MVLVSILDICLYVENEKIFYICFDYKGKHGTVTGGGESIKFNSKEGGL